MRSILIAALLLAASATQAQQTVGLFTYDPASEEGYTIVAPNGSKNVYLVDACGREVHTWTSDFFPGNAVYLLEDGRLLRSRRIPNANFPAGGSGGGVEILDWDSNVLWSYTLSNDSVQHHHDALMLPNGNVLLLAWRRHPQATIVALGRDPNDAGNFLWEEILVEVQPSGSSGGTVVWEWGLLDHLIQDFDNTKPDFGVVSDHPERMDMNYLGVGGGPLAIVDWHHANSIDYNAALDQIVWNSRTTGEFYVIDHSTTTAEAAGHTGGAQGKGGDFLYRWGNPQAYGRGTANDQQLWGQHNVHWIPAGRPDAGKIMVFNNGDTRPAGQYSSVEIIAPPVNANGAYTINPGQPFGPAAPSFTWSANPPTDFYSGFISGAEQLPGGNILACAGSTGRIVEVTPSGQIVWEYVNPVEQAGPLLQGSNPTANGIFRAPRYMANYPGLAGRDLTPSAPLEGNPLPIPSACLSIAITPGASDQLLRLSPNPGQSQLRLQWSGTEPAQASIHDMQGRLVASPTLLPGSNTLDVRAWTSGVYVVRVNGQVMRWVRG